jgi:aminocarboxymuconate-semialdehyde decarboxylase
VTNDEVAPAGEQVGIDVHAHIVPEPLIHALAADRSLFPNVAVDITDEGPRFTFADSPPTRTLKEGLFNADRRADWMSEQRIAVQVVGGWLDVLGYELAGDEGADWASFLTEQIVSTAQKTSGMVPLGTVALQDPARAAQGVPQAVASGCPGIMIGTRAGDLELDDARYDDLWAAADEAGAVVFVHPGFAGSNPRYRDYGLTNGLARLEDTTVTMARLLYAGVPARFPRMKLVIAHGGAALPYVLGRLVQNYLVSSKAYADPVESFSLLHFDSVLFDAASLEFLCRRCGADHVLLGSDFPFPIGDLAPRRVVEESSLTAAEQALILNGNARRLLGVDVTSPEGVA